MLFSCFEAFLVKFRELLILGKKLTISEKSTEMLRKFVFLNKFKKGNSEKNLDLFKPLFLIKPVKGDKY